MSADLNFVLHTLKNLAFNVLLYLKAAFKPLLLAISIESDIVLYMRYIDIEIMPGRMHVTVTISLRPQLNDPEGENIKRALQGLGFGDVLKVRTSRKIEFELKDMDSDRAKEYVEEICKKLLINPIVHEYAIEILD